MGYFQQEKTDQHYVYNLVNYAAEVGELAYCDYICGEGNHVYYRLVRVREYQEQRLHQRQYRQQTQNVSQHPRSLCWRLD